MSKFYASCGSQSLIITALTARHAALKLLDQTLAAHVWIYDDVELSEQDRRDHLTLEALLHLDSSIAVSERGTGRSEAGVFEVPLLLEEWHRLMVGVSRLLTENGLDASRVLPKLQGEPSTQPKQPR
jgi:hypothetical protein